MKKVFIFVLVVLALIGVIVCYNFDYIITTGEYKRQLSVFEDIKDGDSISKSEIVEELGLPSSCYKNGGWIRVQGEDSVSCYDSDVTKWNYTCFKNRDPANPYRLTIEFNQKGKTIKSTFEAIPGG